MVCDPDGCPSSHSAPGFGGPVIPSYASGSQWQAVGASQASAGPKHAYKSALSCQYDNKVSFLTNLKTNWRSICNQDGSTMAEGED